MSTHTFTVTDSDSEIDNANIFKQKDIFTVSDSDSETETVGIVRGGGPSDTDQGIDSLCFNVRRNIQISDGNSGADTLDGLSGDWGSPQNPPPLTPIGGVGEGNMTWQLYLSDQNTGIDSGGYIGAGFSSGFSNGFQGQGYGCATPDLLVLSNPFPSDFTL